jgi:hypothetical protein
VTTTGSPSSPTRESSTHPSPMLHLSAAPAKSTMAANPRDQRHFDRNAGCGGCSAVLVVRRRVMNPNWNSKRPMWTHTFLLGSVVSAHKKTRPTCCHGVICKFGNWTGLDF